MGGGLMQLVAYGAQDIYLTGNPQITFFKVVYRRHTNFSMESIKQTFDGNANFGGNVSATISRNGDLVYRMYLEHNVKFTGDATSDHYMNICSNYGSHLLKEYELEIGGQQIDKHYGHWHSVYSQLTEFNPSGSSDNGLQYIYENIVDHHDPLVGANLKNNSTLFNHMSGNGGGITTGVNVIEQGHNPLGMGAWTVDGLVDTSEGDTAEGRMWIPLYFWFCRNPGLSLPLIALQYHEVKVKMTFDSLINLAHQAVESGAGSGDHLGANGATITSIENIPNINTKDFDLWCDYIYLDTDERRRFAQVSHEYLIEQLQFQSFSSSTNMKLNFNHPVKELIWTNSPSTTTKFIDVNSSVSIDNATAKSNMKIREPSTMTGNFHIKLNGHDRFKERDAKYFTRTQIWEHHTGYGSTINPDAIAVYSFALKPEEHQPSGTCNFSRIDNAELKASVLGDYNVYAVNYNVLRIMSGMGGLAYSN